MTANSRSVKWITRNKKHRLIVYAGVVIVILLFVAACAIMVSGVMKQAKMNKYLKDKYGKEFILKNLRKEGSGLGVEGDLTADAYEEANQSRKFRVWEDPPGVYHDTYLNVVWNAYEEPKLRAYLNNSSIHPVRQYIDIGLERRLRDGLRGALPLDSVVSANGNDVTYGVVVLFSGEQVTDKDKKQLNKIIDYARSKNSLNYSVRYVINSKMANSSYVCQYYGGYQAGGNQNIEACFTKMNGKE